MADRTLWKPIPYACACGEVFPARRFWLIDAGADAAEAERARAHGPVHGACPVCGRAAAGGGGHVELGRGGAILVLGEDERGTLVEVLHRHFGWLLEHPALVDRDLLAPEFEFVDRRAPASESSRVPPPPPSDTAPLRPAPRLVEDHVTVPGPAVVLSAEQAGIPQILGPDAVPMLTVVRAPDLGAFVGELAEEGGRVRATVAVQGAGWDRAQLRARPLLVREHGYPLLGVRIVAAYLGRRGCIDAVLDVAGPAAGPVFAALGERMSLELVLRTPEGDVERTVEGEGLERNVVACLESARGVMAASEHPEHAFATARDRLATLGCADRLREVEPTLPPGYGRHIVSAVEAARALEHLENVSRPEVLARLIEVEGLAVPEYDAIRKRIMEASLRYGLCLPRRFWRRIIASGLASDLEEYVNLLANNRANAPSTEDEPDLPPEQNRAAWRAIFELCELKDIPTPLEVREALGLPDPVELVDEEPRSSAGSSVVSGVIHSHKPPPA